MEKASLIFSKTLTKDDFIRSVLIDLANRESTPADVCSANFGNVEEKNVEAVLCSGHVHTNYTCSVGYDRTETYWDKESRKDSNGNTYMADVQKTRTVTDWQPHSGIIDEDEMGVVFNRKEITATIYDDHDELVGIIKSIDQSTGKEIEPFEIYDETMEQAEDLLKGIAYIHTSFPGDHHKDYRDNGSCEFSKITCLTIPQYYVEFEYNGKKYIATGYACGNGAIKVEYPEEDIDPISKAQEITKPQKRMLIGGWIGFGVSVIVGSALCSINFAFSLIIVAGLAVAITLHVLGNKKYKQVLKELEDDKHKTKIATLKAALEKYNLEPISDLELQDL